MENLSSILLINPSNSHVAVILNYDFARIHFNLRTYNNKTTLLQAIRSVPYNEGNGSLANALNFLSASALNRLLGRTDINRQIALILTDGQYNSDDTRNAASNLQLANIFQVYAIGTPGSNRNQLSIITNSDSSMVYYTDTFSSSILTNIENEVSQQACVGKCHQNNYAICIDCAAVILKFKDA